MAWVTDTARTEAPPRTDTPAPARRALVRQGFVGRVLQLVSRISIRLLAFNLLVVFLPILGVFSLEIYENQLLELPSPPEILDLDQALVQLSDLAPRRARLVELRVFAGMTLDEAAETLGISTATVVREWRSARAWLAKMLSEPSPAAVASA